jgi:hypothetical protein
LLYSHIEKIKDRTLSKFPLLLEGGIVLFKENQASISSLKSEQTFSNSVQSIYLLYPTTRNPLLSKAARYEIPRCKQPDIIDILQFSLQAAENAL